MSMVTQCTGCKDNFRKFSMKSNENKCEKCRGKQSSGAKNLHGQRETRREKDAASFISRLDIIESDFDEFRNTLDAAMDALRIDVKLAVSEQYGDDVLQEKVDNHMGKLKDNLATVNTRVTAATNTVETFGDTIKLLKKRIKRVEKSHTNRISKVARNKLCVKVVNFAEQECPNIWFSVGVLSDEENTPLHGYSINQIATIMHQIRDKKMLEHNGKRGATSRYRLSPEKGDEINE